MNDGELVPYEVGDDGEVLPPLDPLKGGPRLWTTIPIDTEAGLAAFLKIRGKCDAEMRTMGKEVMQVVHITVHDARSRDPVTGQMRRFKRTVLSLVDGTTVSSGSDGVVESLPLLARAFGPPPWPTGRPVRVQQIGLGGGKTFLLLAPVLGAKEA